MMSSNGGALLDTVLVREMNAERLVDQRVHDLLAQFGVWRQPHAAARGLGLGALQTQVDLCGGHQFLVDHGGDVVAIAHPALGCGRQAGGQQAGQQKAQANGQGRPLAERSHRRC